MIYAKYQATVLLEKLLVVFRIQMPHWSTSSLFLCYYRLWACTDCRRHEAPSNTKPHILTDISITASPYPTNVHNDFFVLYAQ